MLNRERTVAMTCRAHRRLILIAALLVLAAAHLLVTRPSTTEAHAFLEFSDPVANSIIPASQPEARLRFTEPVEPEYSRVELYDANGQPVATDESRVADDPYEMILPLPADLPAGTYSIQWRNVSSADGHPQVGYIPFTIGSEADVSAVTVPDDATSSGPPTWISATSRWLSLLGAFAAIGGLISWLWVIAPSIGELSDRRRAAVKAGVGWLVRIGVLTAIVGSILALAVQAETIAQHVSLSTMLDVLRGTRYGLYWMWRIGLLVAISGLASLALTRDDRGNVRQAVVITVGAVTVLIPFALVGHAAALDEGRPAAIAVDWLHLVAASVWIGGLLALLVGLIIGTRGEDNPTRRATFADTINRFSTLAIICIVILAGSGLYSSLLQVGNLNALRETDYGTVLAVKLVLTAIVIALGGVNQRILGPRMRSTAAMDIHFGRTIAAEVLLGTVILFMVGLLTSLPTAREVLAASEQHATVDFSAAGNDATLTLSPGVVGMNRYTVTIDRDLGELPPDSELLLRFSNQETVEGVREARLTPVANRRFEGSGQELSVPGEWDLELILRRPNEPDWRAESLFDNPAEQRSNGAPAPAPRFGGLASVAAVLGIGLAVAGLTIAARRSWNQRGNLALGSASGAALLLAVVTLALTYSAASPASTSNAPVSIGASPEDVALSIQVRDYLRSTFGTPWQAADWYSMLVDITVVDSDVVVSTNLAEDDGSRTTARNICRAVANYNLSQLAHDPTVSGTLVNGISVRSSTGQILYEAAQYVDCA